MIFFFFQVYLDRHILFLTQLVQRFIIIFTINENYGIASQKPRRMLCQEKAKDQN